MLDNLLKSYSKTNAEMASTENSAVLDKKLSSQDAIKAAGLAIASSHLAFAYTSAFGGLAWLLILLSPSIGILFKSVIIIYIITAVILIVDSAINAHVVVSLDKYAAYVQHYHPKLHNETPTLSLTSPNFVIPLVWPEMIKNRLSWYRMSLAFFSISLAFMDISW